MNIFQGSTLLQMEIFQYPSLLYKINTKLVRVFVEVCLCFEVLWS